MNLLEETKQNLAKYGYAVKDIVFIGSGDSKYGCTWAQFRKLADITYDESYGMAKIREDLVIVFKDGSYLSRAEYDGAEWWELRQTPKIPETYEKLPDLYSDYERRRHHRELSTDITT